MQCPSRRTADADAEQDYGDEIEGHPQERNISGCSVTTTRPKQIVNEGGYRKRDIARREQGPICSFRLSQPQWHRIRQLAPFTLVFSSPKACIVLARHMFESSKVNPSTSEKPAAQPAVVASKGVHIFSPLFPVLPCAR